MTIREIEKRLTELALRERSLMEERDRARGRLLYNAEKHPEVNRIVEEVYLGALGITPTSVDRYSQPGRYSIHDGAERLTDVIVYLSAVPGEHSKYKDFEEIAVRLRLKSGFDDTEARIAESSIGAEISSIREEMARLRERKRALRYNGPVE